MTKTNSRFKFRVWDKENKKMMYQPFAEEEDLYISLSDGEIYQDCCKHYATPRVTEFYDLMKFTGLYDCEGKEVFEGDIFSVEAPYYQGVVNFSVEWLQDNLEWVGINELVTFINGDVRREFDNLVGFMRHGKLNHKIIGNRFENPELLEIKK